MLSVIRFNFGLIQTSLQRYQSGFFFQHEVMLQYDYYWRIEPDVKYSCDVDFDPFLYMQDNNKKYGTPKASRTNEMRGRVVLPSLLRPSANLYGNSFFFLLQRSKAFTISIIEYPETIRSLWNTTRSFMQKYPHLLAENNSLEFISDDEGETYNVRRGFNLKHTPDQFHHTNPSPSFHLDVPLLVQL